MCPSLLGIENDEIDEKLGGILFFQVNSSYVNYGKDYEPRKIRCNVNNAV